MNDCILMMDHKTIKEKKLFQDLFEDSQEPSKLSIASDNEETENESIETQNQLLEQVDIQTKRDMVQFEERLNRKLKEYTDAGEEDSVSFFDPREDNFNSTKKLLKNQNELLSSHNQMLKHFFEATVNNKANGGEVQNISKGISYCVKSHNDVY